MDIKFLHYFFKHDPKGGRTIGYSIDPEKGDSVSITTARCSKKESYCKRKGRDLVRQRFDEGKVQTFILPAGINPKNYVAFLFMQGALTFPNVKRKSKEFWDFNRHTPVL